jgi:hypothetical protein
LHQLLISTPRLNILSTFSFISLSSPSLLQLQVEKNKIAVKVNTSASKLEESQLSSQVGTTKAKKLTIMERLTQ